MAQDVETHSAKKIGVVPAPKKKRNKFGAIPTIVDGIRFASKAEARQYEVLRDRQAAGEITDLRLQVRYRLDVNGRKIGTYVSDFNYTDAVTGRQHVTDVKGRITPLYRRSKKHMQAQYGIDVEEVSA